MSEPEALGAAKAAIMATLCYWLLPQDRGHAYFGRRGCSPPSCSNLTPRALLFMQHGTFLHS
jgi:hypothetical protein